MNKTQAHMGNGVVSKSQSHPTAYMPDKITVPQEDLDFNTFLAIFLGGTANITPSNHIKGSYEDILQISKECLDKNFEMIWHIHWSRQNTDDINRLYEMGKDMGIEKVFISGEYCHNPSLINCA